MRFTLKLTLNKVGHSRLTLIQNFMPADGLYLSALSGGADSTALLLQLLEAGCNVEAVHCNFHLRGDESNRDENFCKDLCRDNGVKLHIAHFDTFEYARLHHDSIETAARNLRYNYFFNLVHDLGAKALCVAHNRNDQAETVLMNLVRGAGINGLTGMKAESHVDFNGTDITILRPLLDVSRTEIEAYLRQRKQTWVTDSTNLSDDATRNKFRLDIIPTLEKINPSAIENISMAASRLQMVAGVYDNAIKKSISRITKSGDADKKEISIDIKGLMKETSPEAVLFEILNPYGFNGAQVNDIFCHLQGLSGRLWRSQSYNLVIDRGKIIVNPVDKVKTIEMRIPEEGTYVVKDNKLRIKREPWTNKSNISKDPAKISIDAEKIAFPLTLRTVKHGDRFVPFGMKGSKLVSDFLTDRKFSILEKQQQLILCDAKENVIWLVGLRPDNHCRITKDTKEAITIEFIPQGQE